MSRGRTTDHGYAEIVERNLSAIAALCRRFGVRRLDLFGSAATGRFDARRSDLDFLVKFDPEAQGQSYFRLLEEFEKLFGRKVDLLTEDGLENPFLRRRIETERRTLFPTAMISNQAAAFLWDAQRAAGRITRFAAGRTYDDYLDDDMLRAAVERQFEIIGEAFVGLRRVDPSLAAQLPDLPKVIAFRNVLVHGYATIDHQIVWDAIRDDLPRLLIALNQMLGTPPAP
jgi:uncharacterized protein with HEPN domain/predicted nucleotidyltransferase